MKNLRLRYQSGLLYLLSAIVCCSYAWASAWELPAKKKVLANGLTLIIDKDASSPTTFFQILIKGGQRAEPPEKQGLSFLTTRLSMEIPDSDKVQELMRLASRVSVTSRGDFSVISIECLSANIEATLKVLSRIFLDPLFSGLRIDAVKQYMAHQSKIEEDDNVNIGHLAALRAFMGRPGYQGSIYGNEKTLEAIKNKDVAGFYRRLFTAPNIIFSLSSDLEEEPLLGLIEKCFAGIPGGQPATFDPIVSHAPLERSILIEKDTRQTYISVAFPLPRISTQNFALAYLLENLLGKGPGSRLWPLRTDRRLAYNVNCRATQMQEAGVLEVYLETDHAKRDSALAALQEVLNEVLAKGVTEEELEMSKVLARANFLREHEVKAMRAAALGSFEALGLGYEYFAGLSLEIDALTSESVNAYIQKLLAPENGMVIVVGPKAGQK